MNKTLLGESWYNLLQNEVIQPYFVSMMEEVKREYSICKVLPKPSQVFRAFQLTNPETVKVIILLQDPYPFTDSSGNSHADGLALSTPSSETPASLRVVLREVDRDVVKTVNLREFKEAFPTNDLSSWARQGVLLINTALTVRAGLPNSHQHIWHTFIKRIVQILAEDERHKVFMLWGANARKITEGITAHPNHKILETGHPASGSHGKDLYSGSNHFSKCNYYLWRNEIEEINWKLNG